MNESSLEQAVSSVLQDPQQLEKILALAKAFGLSPPQAPEGASSAQPLAIQTPAPREKPPSPEPPSIGELLQKAGSLDRRQENLLNALKPFLKPERREKIDRAMQAARISRLAGAALRGRDQKES